MSADQRIELEIAIEAPRERVWDLVSQPGWWIGDGDRSQHSMTRDGDVCIVVDPKYGRFPVLLVSSDPGRYVAFRCTWGVEAGRPSPDNSTLIEFWLTEQPGGTLVRLVESGFEVMGGSITIDGNTKGWQFQLGVLKRDSEAVTA